MENYIYIILDITILGEWIYKDKKFKYKPIYVGMGTGRRFEYHFTTKLRKNESNYTKFNLIKENILNGNKPISIKIYDNLDRESAKLIEKDIIKHFGKKIDSSGILTNITDGGEDTPCNKIGGENIHSKKVYQYSIDGKFIKEWDCLREIGRTLGKSFNNIGDCCRGKSKTAYGYQWFYEYKDFVYPVSINNKDKQYKKVYKFDDEGVLLIEYKSLKEACLQNGFLKSAISSHIISGKNYHNYFYSYDKNFKINKSKMKSEKSHFHKIEYNGDILKLNNKEIMKIFNVSRYYITQIKQNKIKNPKFKLIY
jgi:hypothetical protein